MKYDSFYKQTRGFSLIELMIALTIGLILLAGVTLIMISSKRSYNVQNDMAMVQENARFATEFIGRDLRMAGYFGCTGQFPRVIYDSSSSPSRRMAADELGFSVEGRDADGALKSDVIRVTYANTKRNALHIQHCEPGKDSCILGSTNTPFQEGSDTIPVTHSDSRPGSVKAGDPVILTDCSSADVYVVSSVSANSVKLTSFLERDYDNQMQKFGQSYGAAMYPLVSNRYFIGAASSGNGFSLYRDNAELNDALDTAQAEELLEGVENLQIRYGEDTDDDGVVNQYRRADQVSDWFQIRSVRLTLLMQTRQRFDGSFDDLPAINAADLDPDLGSYTPPDQHRRRSLFTTTVMLRNNSGSL